MSQFTDSIIINLTKEVTNMNTITLRNNAVLSAIEIEGGLFEATLKSGVVKYYTRSQIIAINGEKLVLQSQNPTMTKEVTMYHYLRQINKGKDNETTPRYLSTELDSTIAADYNESLRTHSVVNGIFAITTGNWKFHLLINKLARKGHDFTLMIINHADLAKYSEAALNGFVDKANFAFANSSFSFFLKIKGVDAWGLDILGIDLKFGKKAAKRAQEIVRMVEMFMTVQATDVKWQLKSYKGTNPILWDGKSVISMDFAVRTINNTLDLSDARKAQLIHNVESGKISRISLRFNEELGLGKGDGVIVRNLNGLDMITYTDNVKSELIVTNGEFHMCFWDHAPRHLAVWDDQTTVNFPAAFTEHKQNQDIRFLVKGVEDSLAAGTLPQWLVLGADAYNEDGTPNMEKLSETINRQWVKFQVALGDIKGSQNLVYMAINGVVKRMDGDRRNGYHTKMWIPMTNAILASVCTWESMTEMAGMTFLGRDSDHIFFDPRCGLVMPGHRFIETYALHGGWDLDDSVKVVLVKMWSSGNYDAHKGLTLDSRVKLADNAADAGIMALLVRSPNGPTEYSIEMVDTRGMFEGMEEVLNEDSIVTIDMCDMPVPHKPVVVGLPEATHYRPEDSMTREDAKSMIFGQLSNPGFGRVCNAMMSHALIEPGTFPEFMLDNTENIVDATEQGFDAAQFALIEGEHTNIMNQVVTNIVTNGLDVDRAFYATRMSTLISDEQKEMLKSHLVDGRFTRVQKLYNQAITFMRDEMIKASKTWRAETDLAQAVRSFSMGEAIKSEADAFYVKFTAKLALVDNNHKVPAGAVHPFVKMNIQAAKKAAMESVVAEMVAHFEGLSDMHRYKLVVGLYKFLVFGYKADRIIFQPAATGQLSVMDIFIEGVQFFAARRCVAALCTLV